MNPLLLLCWLFFVPQTAPVVVLVNQPFLVVSTHTGVNTDGYRLRVDEVEVQVRPVTALVDGEILFQVTAGLPVGMHHLWVEAYRVNAYGWKTTQSLKIQVDVRTSLPPSSPTNMRTIRVGGIP